MIARIFRFFDMSSMAFLFTAITIALTVIISSLQMQTRMVNGLVQKAGG